MRHLALQRSTGRKSTGGSRPQRGGAITLEFILGTPVLFLTTLAVFEFGILLLVEQAFVTAAIEGAREGAKVGATTNAVAETVQRIIGVHCITFDTTGTASGDARVIIEDGSGVISGERGNLTIDCTPNGPAPSPQQIRVTVCAPVTDAATGCTPVPDWLSGFGFSIKGKLFRVSSVANLE